MNHSVRRLWAAIVMAGSLGLGMIGPAVAAPENRDDQANRAPSFSLVDHTGEAVTDRDFLGRFQLIFFGYTHCPDICPTDLAKMAEAIDLLGPAGARVQPIFVTVDPARDTVAAMADYVGHFHPRLVGLTGAPEDIAALAGRYGVRSRPADHPVDPGAAAGSDYFLDHTGAMYLIGPDGRGLSLFRHQVDAAEIAFVIQQFMARANGS